MKSATKFIILILIVLFLIAFTACLSGWYYGFGIIIPILLLFGVREGKQCYEALLNCKYKFRTELLRKNFRFDSTHYVKYVKRGIFRRFIVCALLMTIGILLYYFRIITLDWVSCIAIIYLFGEICISVPKFLAFHKYHKYLEKFCHKSMDEWDDDDFAFEERLNNQQSE